MPSGVSAKNQIPLLFMQHFTGTLDNWDPAVTDPLANDHDVILFVSEHGQDLLNSLRRFQPGQHFFFEIGVASADVTNLLPAPHSIRIDQPILRD
jgi:hypothetical protein